MRLNGAEILMECLREQGVDTVFGFPGGSVLFVYDALYKYKDYITHYLTSHEQGAAHAADGYARATGKTGVCIATSGPGATNLVTGIATAYMDSVPMVAITGNVSVNLLGKDSFQEVDITGVTMPITKHNFIVKDISKLEDTVRKAFYIAAEGRPGPVLIDITKDVTAAECEYEYKKPDEIKRKVETIRATDLSAAAELINNARKPLIYAGGGIITSGASAELKAFAELIDAPVTLSTMGLGGFPASDFRYTGLVGMHGSYASNMAVTQCDLLIAAGARFSDRVTSKISSFAPKAKILHLDIDPAEINKNVLTYSSVIGDIKDVLHSLNKLAFKARHEEWMGHILEMKKNHPLQYLRDGKLRPQYILERISALTKGKAIVTTDVGLHQMWACQYIEVDEPRSFITSGGLGTMGFGLGAAIGAKVGRPDRIVFNITGDGSLRMNAIELATAANHNIPVIDVLMNNHTLGMVRQWQTFFYGGRFSHTTLPPSTDFIKLAEAYGVTGLKLTDPAQVDAVLTKAIELNRPVLIDCEIDPDEKVFPMVAPGAGIDEIRLE